MTAVLVVTLAGLTASAVIGGWRQALIVNDVAAQSAATDAYREAAYLSLAEAGLIQASLREPDGEERAAIDSAGARTMAALRLLHDDRTSQAELDQMRLRTMVGFYLERLDRGDVAGAQEMLEYEVEPLVARITGGLRIEEQIRAEEYRQSLEQARRDSMLLFWGILLAFGAGLAVLIAVAWSNRTRRRQMERLAATDSLTGLPNRSAFQGRAEAALAGARTGGAAPTVLMLDLDGFKEVNDNLGHHAGDLLLAEVARRLTRAVRDTDTVARLGGDEFAVLITDAEPGMGETAAARVYELFETPFALDGITLDIEVSIGIMTGTPETGGTELMRYADIAMYTAKEHRLGWVRFDPGQAHETASRLTLLGDLRRALEADDELHLAYQPKIAMDTGAVIGAEALARWQHPTRGAVPPTDFIGVLEGTSLIHRFTLRVLDLALRQARTWLDQGHRVPVAVNVSARSLLDPSFPDTVAQALAAAGLPGDMLCVEITENTVMADPDRAIDILRRIRALGVTTAIDDFGTGYSSMAYLKILPVDELKVDRSFVRDMAADHGNHVLVSTAVDLGHNLGLVVVAEGVEDERTAAALRDLHCDVAQGYHFARPLDPEAFETFLHRSGARNAR